MWPGSVPWMSERNQPGIIPTTIAPAPTANRNRSSCRCSMMVMVFSPVSSSSSAGTEAMGCESSATLIRPGVYRGGSEPERYDPAIAISPQPPQAAADPATGTLRYPFALDPFQAEAIDAVERGQSVLLSAPTGAGKTVVAEAAIARALRQGKSVLYT